MFNLRNEFVDLKSRQWIDKQKIAGKAVSECLKNFHNLIKNEKNISLLDIEEQCLSILNSFECKPTFYNYNGFPGKVCLSVNNTIVHGVPFDYKLQNGDVVTLDLGATYDDAIADAAFTCIFGHPKDEKHIEMLALCKKALDDAIANISVGKKLGIIGHTIFNVVKKSGFGLITNYGGHGISLNKPHARPFVSNKEDINNGIIMQPGLSIAIEPMLVMNNKINTRILDDGWSVETDDIGCHFEHSVTIDTDETVIIITNHGL